MGKYPFGRRLEALACSLKHVANRTTEALFHTLLSYDGIMGQTADAAAGVVQVGAGRGRINDYYCSGDCCRAYTLSPRSYNSSRLAAAAAAAGRLSMDAATNRYNRCVI